MLTAQQVLVVMLLANGLYEQTTLRGRAMSRAKAEVRVFERGTSASQVRAWYRLSATAVRMCCR
jgi:hypothetical protein